HRDVDAQAVAALLAALPLVGDVARVLRPGRDDQILAGDRLDDDLALGRRGERVVVLAGRLDAERDQVATRGDVAVEPDAVIAGDRAGRVFVDVRAVEPDRRLRGVVVTAGRVGQLDLDPGRVELARHGVGPRARLEQLIAQAQVLLPQAVDVRALAGLVGRALGRLG